jgi:hypothetical protein
MQFRSPPAAPFGLGEAGVHVVHAGVERRPTLPGAGLVLVGMQR